MSRVKLVAHKTTPDGLVKTKECTYHPFGILPKTRDEIDNYKWETPLTESDFEIQVMGANACIF